VELGIQTCNALDFGMLTFAEVPLRNYWFKLFQFGFSRMNHNNSTKPETTDRTLDFLCNEVQHKHISWTYGIAFALTLSALIWYHRQPPPVEPMH